MGGGKKKVKKKEKEKAKERKRASAWAEVPSEGRRGAAGPEPPRRRRGAGQRCGRSGKPAGKWTRGEPGVRFFMCDNLCPKETVLKIIEMITIHCCVTLNVNSQIMKSS